MTTPHETKARLRKVDRLVGTAVTGGITAEAVASDADVRAALVATAGVNEPSLVTWQLVVRRLAAVTPANWMATFVAKIYDAHAEISANHLKSVD